MMQRIFQRAHDESGQVLLVVVLLTTVFLGMVAMTVDVGLFAHERGHIQDTVDAAALAGAQQLPTNATQAKADALTYAMANDSSMTATVTFRCIVGDRDHNGQPDAGDIGVVCNPGANGSWTCSAGRCASLCVPSEGDACNTIVVGGSKNVPFVFARAIHIASANTGDIEGVACRGDCGGAPSGPVDLVLIMDRTGSMSSSDVTNARNAANSILQVYDPNLQWVALGLLGPSNTGSSCAGSDSPANGLAANSSQYDNTTVGKWVPVGLSGVGAPVNEAYLNANGTLNTNSLLVKAIRCFDTSSTGTNLSTPVKMARQYLLAHGRPGVKKGIILETDGNPNYNGAGNASDFTCQAAFNEAQAAKTAAIEIFTIGFGLAGTDMCPDSSGIYRGSTATKVLADMATASNDNGCTSTENSDGDHFFCLPRTSQLTGIFQTVAGSLAPGSHLVSLP
jgi:Flp pilus assembly protein TadG